MQTHFLRSIVFVAFAATATHGCAETRYVLQAGPGQLELFTKAQAIERVVDNPETDPRTRVLLQEVEHIREFATANGLAAKDHYRKYVDLNRSAVVYFLAASRPLSFTPKLWSFPIVGSFPYTGWFDYWHARRVRARLERDGWDVTTRPVRAYSTGGWLDDPILSTMFTGGDNALQYLVNVVLHELTHANFFIPNQATFNESLASFVGDQMADDYLVARFGADATEVLRYREDQQRGKVQESILAATYAKLEALYASEKNDATKRKEKRGLLRQLRIDADLAFEPNNASLIGFKTYNSGLAELGQLFAGCNRDWLRFFQVVRTLTEDRFPKPQLEKLGPFIDSLARSSCPRSGPSRPLSTGFRG